VSSVRYERKRLPSRSTEEPLDQLVLGELKVRTYVSEYGGDCANAERIVLAGQ
jgi:hypothetical protein